MMADNNWSPDDLQHKVEDAAKSPGVSDAARIELMKLVVRQYVEQTKREHRA